MTNTFNELFQSFKNLSEQEKKMELISFLKNDIISLQKINSDIGNLQGNQDIDNIASVNLEDELDIIYQLLHILTEQVEMFTEKVANDFYE